MQERDVRDLLEATATQPAPPTAVDLDRAVREGRRTRTTRRALLAGGAALGVSAVVLGASATLRPARSTPTPLATASPEPRWPPPPYGTAGGPTLPRVPPGFDLFGQWAVFGWLPSTPERLSYRASSKYVGIRAQAELTFDVSLFLDEVTPDEPLRMGGTSEAAPEVAGRPARWVTASRSRDEQLQWRYAPRTWAVVSLRATNATYPEPTGAARRDLLHRVASGVGLSAERRQRFPFRAGAVPSDLRPWQISLLRTVDGGWEALVRAGTSGSFKIKVTNIPPVSREILPLEGTDLSKIVRSIDGHEAYHLRTSTGDSLVVWLPDDVTVEVAASGTSLPKLGPGGALEVYHGIEVLHDPASWVEKPI
jgi:hypothetical protein